MLGAGRQELAADDLFDLLHHVFKMSGQQDPAWNHEASVDVRCKMPLSALHAAARE